MQKMNSRKKRKMSINNLSGIRRIFTLNIGTIIFGILFIYIIISILLYVTATHVTSYQVTKGPLTKNQNYTGLAFYSETVFTADTGGYVNYFIGDSTKVKSGGAVYGISQTKREENSVSLTSETLSRIGRDMRDFTLSFDPSDFHDTYSLKYQIEGEILNQSLSEIGSVSGTVTVGNETVNTASRSGIVVYSLDGYENLNIEDVTNDDLNEKNYYQTSLKSSEKVEAGSSVYKLIDSENWSLIIPLTSKQIVDLGDTKKIRVKFLKDGITQRANFSIITKDNGSYFGRLDFDSGLVNYLDSRFVDIELVTNTEVGLKIPVSSVVNKSFYTIPDEFAIKGGDSEEIGFMKATGGTPVFTTTTLYEHSNGKYYVDDSVFGAGDIIVKESSTDRYIIRDTASLEGVFCMNKGYAEFRKISIIDKNEDYCLVKEGTDFGISQYDNIVLDASTVKESQITAIN